MRHNNRPPLDQRNLPKSADTCPERPAGDELPGLRHLASTDRGMLPAHRAADGMARCPGSGQRVVIDLTPPQWQARLDAAVREAGLRHGSRVHRGGRPPVAPPVFRIARAA